MLVVYSHVGRDSDDKCVLLYFGLLNSFKTEPDVSDCFTRRQTNIKYKGEYKRALTDENMQEGSLKGIKQHIMHLHVRFQC